MKKYDIVFLVEWAIGNTIEVLYAVEYCIKNSIKTGIVLNKLNKAFKDYLKLCYGEEIIIENKTDIFATNLVHVFIHYDIINIKFDNYFYIYLDENSTQYNTETQQYLSLVRAIYPSNHEVKILEKLKAEETNLVKSLNIKDKYVIYHGSANHTVVKRWPYYIELMEKLGEENVIFVGGGHEEDFTFSYIYPKYITKIVPKAVTNRIIFWRIAKKIKLLKPYTKYYEILNYKNAYINKFSWGELVAIFRNCKAFIGNDGGLMHLAAVSRAKGIAIFGPSSINKNRPFSDKIKIIHRNFECQPCQFNKAGVSMSRYFVSCPYQIKCLSSIKVDEILHELDFLNIK